MPKRPIEEEIEAFLDVWNCNQIISLFEDIRPLVELYDVDEKDDWVKNQVGDEYCKNVRLVRTVYLLSIIAENHSGKMAEVRIHHKDLYKRLEKFVGEKQWTD